LLTQYRASSTHRRRRSVRIRKCLWTDKPAKIVSTRNCSWSLCEHNTSCLSWRQLHYLHSNPSHTLDKHNKPLCDFFGNCSPHWTPFPSDLPKCFLDLCF
jgi:hypothetical protein